MIDKLVVCDVEFGPYAVRALRERVVNMRDKSLIDEEFGEAVTLSQVTALLAVLAEEMELAAKAKTQAACDLWEKE